MARNKGIFFFCTILLFLSNCTDNKYNSPVDCNYVVDKKKSKRLTFKHLKLGIDIPQDWETEEMPENNNSVGIVALDTTQLYKDETVKSITFTTVYGEIKKKDIYFQNELKLMGEKYKVVDNGIDKVNGHELYWALVRDNDFSYIIYYIFKKYIHIINLCISDDDSLEGFCELTNYLNTLK